MSSAGRVLLLTITSDARFRPIRTFAPSQAARDARKSAVVGHWLSRTQGCGQIAMRNVLAMELFDDLLDDETLIRRPQTPFAAALADHRELRDAYGSLLATLVVPDTQLGMLSRQVPDGVSVRVSVITTAGAGGLLALARRDLSGVEIISAEPALRDLDDLAGGAARVASAAAELADEIAVFVEVPYAPGWEAAIELIEAAGLFGKIDAGGGEPSQTVEQLSILIEADLPFKIANRLDASWLALLRATDALIEGVSLEDAAELLRPKDHDQIGPALAAWDDKTQLRIRRRVQRLGTDQVRNVINDLVAHGLLAAP